MSAFLRMARGVVAVILTAAVPSMAAPQQAPPLVFGVVADLHVTDSQSMDGFRQAIEQFNSSIKPAFVYIAGDTPDGGTAQQYELYKSVRDKLKCPVHDVAGDHEARGGGLEHYRRILGPATDTFEVQGQRFVSLSSMELDAPQLDWAGKQLAGGKAPAPIVLIHHNLAGLKDRAMAATLDKLLDDSGVSLVLAGHTHTNTVINKGARVDITTTSVKAPRGSDPAGFAVVTVDGGQAAWHFVPLGRKTIVAVCSPVSKLMATNTGAVVKGRSALRVEAYDPGGIRSVTARIGAGEPMSLARDEAGVWCVQFDSSGLKDGEQSLKVTATSVEGETASEEIVFLVNQAGQFKPQPASETDGQAAGKEGGPKGPKGEKPEKQKITLEQMPEAVTAAIKPLVGNGELEKLEKETKDGVTSFKAAWRSAGQKHELKLSSGGEVLETKQEITPADLPPQVAQAAKQALGKIDDAECQKITRTADGREETRYELKVDTDAGKQHIVVGGNGSVEVKGPKPEGKQKPPAPAR